MTRVASFDVFDTVITRQTGSPRQVFVVTGARLRDAGVVRVEPRAYAAVREEAISDLTVDTAHHPSLRRIAEEVAARLGLPDASVDDLVTAELDVERAVCRAVPGAVERVARSRRETGRGVLFVSDTPLPTAFLQELLVREGLFLDGDRLYTSADCGASKQEGGLFDLVAADQAVPPAELVHVGDDRWADLAHPRLHGWRAELDTRAVLTGRERVLDADTAAGSLGPRLAGASRRARLAAATEGIDPGLASIAGGVALPLLGGFGLWVLGQARLLGLDRLYFVSRDGEVFREVTQRLAAQAGDPIEMRYLYGSRKSWQLASQGASSFDHVRDLWVPDQVSGASLTMREALSLVGMSPAEAREVTGLELFTAGAGEVLGAEGWARLRDLMATAPLDAEIRRRARERRDLLVRYLEQEGLTGPGRVGLVDVGWTGRAARSLEDVLIDAGARLPAAHLFVGLSATAPERMGEDLFARSRGWLMDEARGRRARSAGEDPVMLVESFAMGTEGHTLGYAVKGDEVVPELAAEQNPAGGRWQLAEFRRVLGLALDALLDGPVLDQEVDLRPVAWRQLLDFWRAPSTAEALAWGAQPYGEDFDNARSHPLATPVTARRLLTRLGVGRPDWRQPTYWLAGTLAVSPQPWRGLLRVTDRAQHLATRLPRVPSRLRGEWAMRRRPGA